MPDTALQEAYDAARLVVKKLDDALSTTGTNHEAMMKASSAAKQTVMYLMMALQQSLPLRDND